MTRIPTIAGFGGRLGSSTFLARASILTGGSLAAQAVGFLALPFVAVLYGPIAYGQFAVVQAIAGIASVSTLLRYDMALVQAKDERDAVMLARVAVVLSCGLIPLVGLVLLALWPWLTPGLGLTDMGLWWVPLCVTSGMLGAWSMVATGVLLRHMSMTPIAASRIAQSLAGVAAQLLLAVTIGADGIALVAGMVAGQLIACLILWRAWRRAVRERPAVDDGPVNPAHSIAALMDVARRFAEFPRHAASTVILNSVSVQLLPIAISAFFGPALAGAVALTQRLTQFPVMLVTSQVWQLVFARLRELDAGGRRTMLRRIQVASSFGFALPLAVVAVNAEPLIGLLGERWSIVLPGYLAAFCLLAWLNATSNLISYFTTFGRFGAESAVNVMLFVVRLAALAIGGLMLAADLAVIAFALVSAAFYVGLAGYWGRTVLGLGFVLSTLAAAFLAAVGGSSVIAYAFAGSTMALVVAYGALALAYYGALGAALFSPRLLGGDATAAGVARATARAS